MKMLSLGFTAIILRFYLMMAIVIAAGFIGQWGFALLALPIFLSIILGVSFMKEAPAQEKKKVRRQPMEKPIKIPAFKLID